MDSTVPHPLGIDEVLHILSRSDPASPFYVETAKFLEKRIVAGGDLREFQESPEDAAAPFLTIGMATYDDFDGVFFSVQAIRLYHPEVAGVTEILIVDNHPDGAFARDLRDLASQVPGCRYVAAEYPQGTGARDLVFREARGEFVLCSDSHVYFSPGSLASLVDYLRAHRDSPDLLQGPLLGDDLEIHGSHFDPVWSKGMWGTWGYDERSADLTAEPFDIPSQGLAVFACRRDVWPGFNPRLSGFGGEEGCLHEKFRQAGGRTLCLPFLRWLHRFPRPNGVPYRIKWEDRIRNYLIWYDELGLDPAPVVEHFLQLLGPGPAQSATDAARRGLANPFNYFDAIYCINLDRDAGRWQEMTRRFEKLGIVDRVRRFRAIETPHNHHIGCALSHRTIIAEAKRHGLRNVLVFEDDVLFTEDALQALERSIVELKTRRWETFYLGGYRWGQEYEKAEGCSWLEVPDGLTCTHAIAYSDAVYDHLLSAIPATAVQVGLWLREWKGVDQYYAASSRFDGRHLLMHPIIATQRAFLSIETREFSAAD